MHFLGFMGVLILGYFLGRRRLEESTLARFQRKLYEGKSYQDCLLASRGNEAEAKALYRKLLLSQWEKSLEALE